MAFHVHGLPRYELVMEGKPSLRYRTPRPSKPTPALSVGIWVWSVAWCWVVVDLVLLQGLGQLLTIGRDSGYAEVTSVDILWRTILVPIELSLVLV